MCKVTALMELDVILNITERKVYTYLLNLSRNKLQLAFPKTLTIASYCQISQTLVNKVLRKLQNLNLIFCVDTKKKLRFWRVFELKKICISKKQIENHHKNSAKIKQKVMNKIVHKSVHNSPLLFQKLGSTVSEVPPLLFQNSIDVSSNINRVFIKEYLEPDDRNFPQNKKLDLFRASKNYAKLARLYGKAKVDEKLDEFQAQGRLDKIDALYSYTRTSLESDVVKQKQSEVMLKNDKLLRPKITAILEKTDEIAFCFGKKSLECVHKSGAKTKIDLTSSELICDLELRYFIQEHTKLNLRV